MCDWCDTRTIDKTRCRLLAISERTPPERGYHKRQAQAIGRSVPIGPFFAPPSDKRSPLGLERHAAGSLIVTDLNQTELIYWHEAAAPQDKVLYGLLVKKPSWVFERLSHHGEQTIMDGCRTKRFRSRITALIIPF